MCIISLLFQGSPEIIDSSPTLESFPPVQDAARIQFQITSLVLAHSVVHARIHLVNYYLTPLVLCANL